MAVQLARHIEVVTPNADCYKRSMKLRVYLSLFAALAILTVSTGCIISHCTTPADGGAPTAAIRPGLEQELKKDVRYLARDCHPRPAGYEKKPS